MVELSPKARNPKSSMMTNQSPEQPVRNRLYVFIDESGNVDYSRGLGASRPDVILIMLYVPVESDYRYIKRPAERSLLADKTSRRSSLR